MNELGVSIDLGTTVLAGQIVNSSGGLLAEATVGNPQKQFGSDILTRLQQAHEGQGLQLQQSLIDGLTALLSELCQRAGIAPGDIGTAAAAGNPGMSCLLRNLPVASLLFPPHKPPYKELIDVPTEEVNVGLSVPLQLFPLVSGFVGGDLVAVLIGLDKVKPGTVVMDIGTNGELALWDGKRWWVSSAAAGPAFEGGNIATGMTLVQGAVTGVALADDRLHLAVAGGTRPKGLCGSGLAALIAVARQGGLIDDSGRILAPDEVHSNLVSYLMEDGIGWGIRFYRDAQHALILTQEDVRNFQLAKGALRAGLEVLLERAGISPHEAVQVLITGALGTTLPVEVLKRVALLPEPMLDKTLFIANGVLAGLRRYLTDASAPMRLKALLNTVQPFPLSGTPAFEKRFLAALNF